jgi:hypothetical protein
MTGGSCRLSCGCTSCYCRCHDGHCTEVQECEGLLFPSEPLERSAPVVASAVAWLCSGITASGLALDSVLCTQGCLDEVLVEGVVKSPQGTACGSWPISSCPALFTA